MASVSTVRKVDNLGRIIIPHSLRRRFQLAGNLVEIFVEGTDTIIFQKYIGRCVLCASTQQVSTFHDKEICAKCKKDLANCL